MTKQSHPDGKKPYEKPVVSRFAMRVEEAVLGFCKNNSSSGPSGGQCMNVHVCRVPGS